MLDTEPPGPAERPVMSGRRRFTLVALVAGLVTLLLMQVSAAHAAPGDPGSIGQEGGTPTLAQVLEETGRAYFDAQAVLTASKARQAELTQKLTSTETQLTLANAAVSTIASAAYRSGGLRTAAALLGSRGPDSFVERASFADTLTRYSDQQLHHLNKLKKDQSTAKAAIDAEVAIQQKQFDVLSKQKNDAERALAAAGGKAIGGFVSATSPLAVPAPRNANGSWPAERCIIDDPTTPGCLTPRMAHALKQAQANNFKRYVACYRSGGPYEHPKGRACDFAAAVGGFGGAAVGQDQVYGSNLAMFFVRNADRLGVLYVIWYRKIWHPTCGCWRTYNGGSDPASAHTNHVHLSVY